MSAPFSHRKNAPAPTLSTLRHEVTAAFLDALFPPRCAGCRGFCRAAFCPICADLLRPMSAPFCLCCGEPFDPLAFAAPRCIDCRASPPKFAAARAAGGFDGPLREAIHRFKYGSKRALAPRLAPMLLDVLRDDETLRTFAPQFLVPIPLHPARLRKRGFNQSELLARELAFLAEIPCRDWLRRTRNTPPQVGLSGVARQKNIRGAFAVTGDLTGLKGARILLIDDVFTTGATLDAAARALRAAGGREVCALTLGRALAPGFSNANSSPP